MWLKEEVSRDPSISQAWAYHVCDSHYFSWWHRWCLQELSHNYTIIISALSSLELEMVLTDLFPPSLKKANLLKYTLHTIKLTHVSVLLSGL